MILDENDTPLSQFRMPAEWEPHAGTWLTWPHQRSDWPGRFAPIPWVYGEIVRTLARFEDVNLLVREKDQTIARRVLNSVMVDWSRVHLHVCPSNRSWARDSGPIFVRTSSGSRTILDWGFNAWAKYPDYEHDDRIPGVVANLRGLPALQPTHRGRRVVLEGGGIDVNGAGLVLTTEEWLLSDVQQRNPTFGRADYEEVFATYLGATKTLWLNRGIIGDDTHGHIDDLARFVSPRTVVTAVEGNEADANYQILHENLDRLKGMTDVKGRKLEVVELPMPAPLVFKKTRLPASYANFYIANDVVIVPTFNDPADRRALGILAELLPDREIIGISCTDLIWGLGTLHCMTQQEPAP